MSKPVDYDSDWRKKASCLKRSANDPALMKIWVDETSEFHYIAQEICATCPVREACLDEALSDSTAEGIRAGVFFHTGKVDAAGVRFIRENFPDVPPARIRKKYADRVDLDEEV